jgi:hypothetical protein
MPTSSASASTPSTRRWKRWPEVFREAVYPLCLMKILTLCPALNSQAGRAFSAICDRFGRAGLRFRGRSA